MENSGGTYSRLSTGILGLDSLLKGGLVNNRLYLLVGAPGTGKTLLGARFLRTGLNNDEDVLFVHGEESKEDLLVNAGELNIDLTDAAFLDIGPESAFFTESQSYDIVDPQDIEDDHLISDIRETVEQRDPDRVLIDPISQLQYIEPSEYLFRKRIIAFTRFLTDNETTVLATKTPGAQMDEQLRSLSDGVISLTHRGNSRRISVPKHRVVGQHDGTHGLEIQSEGISVYPALQPARHNETFDPEQLSVGIEGFDTLLGGGIEKGTVTIISGPSGVGKSTTAAEFLDTAAANGSGVVYLFEESVETFTHRSESFDIPVTQMREAGSLTVEEILPRTHSPEEFAHQVKDHIEEQTPGLVVLDGIEGYRNAIKGSEQDVDLRQRLHALTRYLTNMNVTVILIDERHEVTGLPQPTGSSLSYLADNLVFQQYIELEGELQRVVGVLKKRVGDFEATPRRFSITSDGITIDEPVTNLHGVFEGVPERDDSHNKEFET